MIKAVITFTFLLFCAAYVSAELLIPLNSQAPLDTGELDCPHLFKTGEGDFYFVYLKDQQLAVQRSTDNGLGFHMCTVDYKGRIFSSISSLQLYKSDLLGWLVVFCAYENANADIYLLQIGVGGVVELLITESVCSGELAGDVEDYRVISPVMDGFAVAYTRGGRFAISLVKADLSVSSFIAGLTGVTGFTPKMNFINGNPLFCGTLSAAAGSGTVISYFQFDGYQLLTQPVLNSAGNQAGQSEFFILPSGSLYFIYLENGMLYGSTRLNNNWQAVNNGEPLSQAADVFCFSCFFFDNNLYLFAYKQQGSAFTVYGSIIKKDNTPELINSGQLLFGESAGSSLSFAPCINGNILIHYLAVAGADRFIRLWRYNTASSRLENYPLAVAGSPDDGFFFYSREAMWLLTVSSLDGGKHKLFFYEYAPETDSYRLKQEAVVYDGSEVSEMEDAGGGILQFNTPSGKYLIEPFSGSSMLVAAESAAEVFTDQPGLSFCLLESNLGVLLYEVSRGVQE